MGRLEPRLVFVPAGADVRPDPGGEASHGFKKISIRPQPADLLWAKGRVPTPQGDVVVSWVMGEGKFTLDVTVPTGTDAEIELPVSRFGKPVILMNGQKVGPKVNVSAGVNHFEITGDLT